MVFPDEPILFDFGAKIEGYCSDLSRTVCLSSGGIKYFPEKYNIVLGSQMAAINQIQAGISVGDADVSPGIHHKNMAWRFLRS
jgi:Xaa-Pro aminopeptidase